jgi:chromosome segregation ATPase
MTLDRPDAGVVWSVEQMRRLLDQTSAVLHELAHARSALEGQRRTIDDLQTRLALVEGRTTRHEAIGDVAQSLQQELGDLAERVDEESSLRRDREGASERARQRDQAQLTELTRELGGAVARLQQLERHAGGDEERQRHFNDTLAAEHRLVNAFDQRIGGLERRLEAMAEATARDRDGWSRVDAALPPQGAAIEALQVRTASLVEEQRRLGDDLAYVQSERDREADLREIIDQQRATRQRLEERLNALDERVEELALLIATAAEERRGLRLQMAGSEERLRALFEDVERQRSEVVDHFQRVVAAETEQGRKEIAEIERRLRSGRSLLVRLAERSEQAGQEQPL